MTITAESNARATLDRLVSLSRGYGLRDMASGDWQVVDRATFIHAIRYEDVTGWVVLFWETGYPSGGWSNDYAYWTGPYGDDVVGRKFYAAGSDNVFGRGRGGVVGGGALTDLDEVLRRCDQRRAEPIFIIEA